MGIESKKVSIKRLIVRLIHDNEMKPGQRLPAQNELRGFFGCGGATLAAAIGELCEEGVLTARDKVGVFVKDSRAARQYSRRIGLIAGELTGSPFPAYLNVYLEQALSRYGCRSIWLHQREAAASKLHNSLEDISNLRECLENHELDGVIASVYGDARLEKTLTNNRVRWLYISNYAPLPNNICLDYASLTERSVTLLATHGLRRIEMMMAVQLDYMESIFTSALRKNGLSGGGHCFHCLGGSTPGTPEYEKWVEEVFAGWIARSQEERPEALVVPDDLLALRLQLFLCRHPEWRPAVLVLYNDNLKLPMLPSPYGHWRVSVGDYAEFIARNFITMLRNDAAQLPFLSYMPEFVCP